MTTKRMQTLFLGTVEDVARVLEDKPASLDDLRIALINALRHIDQLERRLPAPEEGEHDD